MSRLFQTDIDLLGFSLLNAYLHPVSSDPGGLGTNDKGRIWFNSTTNKLMVWNGTAAIDFLARANHSGTQVASTISDLATAVQAYRLDQFAVPTADLSINSHKLTNVTDGSGAQDAATKGQLDAALAALASGQTLKGAVVAAAVANVTIASPGATIDGISASNGEIYLLTAQSTGSQNGPYVFNGSGTPMTRAANWDTSGEAVLGSYWIVEKGTHADEFALLSNDSALTLGTTTPAFVFRGAAGSTYTAGNGLTLSGSDFNVGAGTGISVAADSVAVDTSVVARKVKGTIPASTSGIVTIAGAVATINHALANDCVELTIRYGSSGAVPGALVEVGDGVVDANNVAATLPHAPSANEFVYMVVG